MPPIVHHLWGKGACSGGTAVSAASSALQSDPDSVEFVHWALKCIQESQQLVVILNTCFKNTHPGLGVTLITPDLDSNRRPLRYWITEDAAWQQHLYVVLYTTIPIQ